MFSNLGSTDLSSLISQENMEKQAKALAQQQVSAATQGTEAYLKDRLGESQVEAAVGAASIAYPFLKPQIAKAKQAAVKMFDNSGIKDQAADAIGSVSRNVRNVQASVQQTGKSLKSLVDDAGIRPVGGLKGGAPEFKAIFEGGQVRLGKVGPGGIEPAGPADLGSTTASRISALERAPAYQRAVRSVESGDFLKPSPSLAQWSAKVDAERAGPELRIGQPRVVQPPPRPTQPDLPNISDLAEQQSVRAIAKPAPTASLQEGGARTTGTYARPGTTYKVPSQKASRPPKQQKAVEEEAGPAEPAGPASEGSSGALQPPAAQPAQPAAVSEAPPSVVRPPRDPATLRPSKQPAARPAEPVDPELDEPLAQGLRSGIAQEVNLMPPSLKADFQSKVPDLSQLKTQGDFDSAQGALDDTKVTGFNKLSKILRAPDGKPDIPTSPVKQLVKGSSDLEELGTDVAKAATKELPETAAEAAVPGLGEVAMAAVGIGSLISGLVQEHNQQQYPKHRHQ
jgi:hypothetical protein